MSLIATCIFYNNAEGLELMCKTVRKLGLDIVAIDGRFREFPGDKLGSTDGSIDVARKYCEYIKADESFLANQMTKRNRYIKEIQTGDHFLVIDDDEILRGSKIDTSKMDLDTYALRYIYPAENYTKTTIRVHRKYDDLMYAIRHCYLFRGSEMDTEALKELEALNGREPGPKLAARALAGTKTRCTEPNILRGTDHRPIDIIHYPEKRSVERQHADNIYTSTRHEVNLNQYLKYPDRSMPADLPEDVGQDCIVRFEGTRIFNDSELGTIMPDDEKKCKYKYALKLQEDFGVFEIVKIIDSHRELEIKKLNARIDRLEHTLARNGIT